MKVESMSKSPEGRRRFNVPSASIGISQTNPSPMLTSTTTASVIIEYPASSEPAWCGTPSISAHVVVNSAQPPRVISSSKVPPFATLASSSPIAIPPPFSLALFSVTTTTQSPGLIVASQVSTSSTIVPVSEIISLSTSNAG